MLSTAAQRRNDALVAIVEASPWFMEALAAVERLKLDAWCIGAGAVRNLVWDHLHGHTHRSALADVDVAYFEANNLNPERERQLQALLEADVPGLPWEVTNQAAVHLWFEGHFGHPVAPLRSLEEAVASWPEYATAVGVTVDGRGRLQVIAPWGLDDLFELRVRRNPTRVSLQTYRQRTAQKRYAARWPKVTIEL
jgi:hypothetical protein